MCAVFKVAKALYLDLRWTPLWSGKWQHKCHVSFQSLQVTISFSLSFVKSHQSLLGVNGNLCL